MTTIGEEQGRASDALPVSAQRPPHRGPSRALALLLAALAGATLGAAAVGLIRRPAPPTAALSLSVDPAAYLPIGLRGFVLADVTRLRASPAVAAWLGGPGDGHGEGEACETRLLRGVRRVAVALPSAGLDDFAVAFAGDLPRSALLACARSRRGGAGTVLSTSAYRGFEVVRIARRRAEGLLPDMQGAEIVYLPGVVLAGAPETVRRMLDQGLGAPPALLQSPGPLAELRRRLGAGHALEAALIFPRGGGSVAGNQPAALEHIEGLALGVDVETRLIARAVLACDDFDAPRAVSDALAHLRDRIASEPGLGALGRVSLERRASDVVVELALAGPDALGLAARLADELAPLIGRDFGP